jgi:cytochrome b involved in lipid metabolism
MMKDFEHLRVGRIVPDIAMEAIQKHQIVIHDWVFDISNIASDHPEKKLGHWIYANISKLGGRDLSKAIEAYDETGTALEHLYQNKDLIIGKLPIERRLISIPDGELLKHNEPTLAKRAWVAANGFVYDVTSEYPLYQT